MNPSRSIVVAGGGIGGLTAALALAARGHRVTVCEAAVQPRPLGVGINLLPHAVRVLAGQESFRTAPLLQARAWAMLPEADTHLQAGCLVAVHPLRPGATSCLDASPA